MPIDLGPGPTLLKVSVGPMDNNAYLLTTAAGTVLLDAAADAARLLEVLGDGTLSAVVTTHRHDDHLGALATLARCTDAALYCGAEDLEAVESATRTRQRPLRQGDTVPLPGLPGGGLGVIALAGHTPGSVALVLAAHPGPGGPGTSHVFTGDSLFPGGPGKTADALDFTTLMDALQSRVFDRFPDDTVVHPGHGDATTLGAERPQLDGWRARGW